MADPCAPFIEAFSKLVEAQVRLCVSDGSVATLSSVGVAGEPSAEVIKKVAPDAAALAAEAIRLALVEAIMRAKKHAEATVDPSAEGAGPTRITAKDVQAILPQLLLDFC